MQEKKVQLLLRMLKSGKGDYGYNAQTDNYEKLYASGVIDPAKVARVALENAASVAGMFLTTEAVIVDEKEDLLQVLLREWAAECQE